jgi:hypothetical protein
MKNSSSWASTVDQGNQGTAVKLLPGDPVDRCPGLPDDKIFGLLGAEIRFSTPFEAFDQNTGESKDAGSAARKIELAYPSIFLKAGRVSTRFS